MYSEEPTKAKLAVMVNSYGDMLEHAYRSSIIAFISIVPYEHDGIHYRYTVTRYNDRTRYTIIAFIEHIIAGSYRT